MPPNQPGSAYRRYTQDREQHPEDLRLPLGVPATLRAVGRTYIRRLWPLLVAITVPLAPAILLCALFIALPGYAVADGAPTYLGTPAAWQLTAWGLTAAVALVGAAVALGAGFVLAGASLLGRNVPVTTAWRTALRRLPVLLAWEGVTTALVVAALWVVLIRSQESEMALPVLVLLLLLPFSLLMAVWSVALSAALLEGRGLLEACRRGWEMGIACRTTHMVLVLIFTVVSVAAVVGAELAAGRIAESGTDQLLSLAARGAVLTLSAPLMLLLLCTPGVHSSPVSPWDLDLARVGANLPAAGATVWPRPRVTVPLTALAVVLPVVAVPLAPVLSPAMTVQTVSASMAADKYTAQQMAVSDGTAFLMSSGRDPLTVCDPECEPVEDALGPGIHDATATVEDGYVVTSWKRDPEAEGEPWEEEPPLDGGLTLLRCSGPVEDGCRDTTSSNVRTFPDVPFQSSISPLDDGVVIASYADPTIAMKEEGTASLAGLRAHVCEDAECSDPREVDLSDEVSSGPHSVGSLDVAASPDGGFAVTVLDRKTGVLTLTHCADPACADPATTELSGQNIFQYLDKHPESGRFGAQVEYRPDGTPVIAHRDTELGEAHLLDCHDAACTESTARVLAGPSWARTTPGLAIDSQGFPQVATVDMDARQLTLISCRDSGCSNHTSVPLAEFNERPGTTLLELDAQDRPHLLWARFADHHPWESGTGGEYLRCSQPRCGVPAQEP